MNGLDPAALDRWITGGDPHRIEQMLTCEECGQEYLALCMIEYGMFVEETEHMNCPGPPPVGEEGDDHAALAG